VVCPGRGRHLGAPIHVLGLLPGSQRVQVPWLLWLHRLRLLGGGKKGLDP